MEVSIINYLLMFIPADLMAFKSSVVNKSNFFYPDALEPLFRTGKWSNRPKQVYARGG